MSEIKNIKHAIIRAIGGDLRLRGEGSEDVFNIKGDIASIDHNEAENTITISSGGDCSLNIPSTAMVEISNIGGDAKITDFDNLVTVGNVGGDLILRHIVQGIVVDTIGSDLVVRHIDGTADIKLVNGDMDCRDIVGELSIGLINGDLSIRDVEGNIEVKGVQGDLLLILDYQPEMNYKFAARSDIMVNITEDTNATFHLPEGVEFDEEDIAEFATIDEGKVVFGNGSAQVHLTGVDGDNPNEIIFTNKSRKKGFNFNFDFDFDFPDIGIPEPPEAPDAPDTPFNIRIGEESLGEFISRRVSEGMAKASAQWSGEAGSNWKEREKDRVSRMEQRAERQAERAMRQAERSKRHAERHVERMEKRRIHVEKHFGHKPPNAQNEPVEVSEEERMLILNMLEEGKISVEEAENLLRTMEGK